MDDVGQALNGKGPGTKVQVTVNRVGVERTGSHARTSSRVGVVGPVGELPPPPANSDTAANVAAPRPRLGVRTLPVSDEVRQFNNLPDVRGATVIAVTPGSPAEQSGIPLGEVVTAVNDQPIETPQGLAAAVAQSGNEIELTYFDHGQQTQKRVTLAQAGLPGDVPKLELRARPVDPPARPMPTDEPTPAEPAQTVEPATPIEPTTAQAPAEAGSSHVAELEAHVRELEARSRSSRRPLTQQKSDAK